LPQLCVAKKSSGETAMSSGRKIVFVLVELLLQPRPASTKKARFSVRK
jgi:hypothetical protein